MSDHDFQQQQGYQAPPPGPPPGYRPTPPGARKSPGLAAFLSAILPGLGNVYVGYAQRGIFQGLVFAGIITVLSAPGGANFLEPLLGISVGFWWIFCMLDAHRRAQVYNLAVDGGRLPDLPGEIELPGMGGSMAGGVTLVVLGTLLFLHTRFDMDMEWLEEWWPLGLVLFGGWLIHKARRQRGGRTAAGGGEETP